MRALPLLAVLALAPAPLDVPRIDGHLTDPGRKLSPDAKKALEDRLTKLGEETHIDVAGWISDATGARADALGEAFYRRWGIGRDWDGGVFLMFPADGPVHVVLEPGQPKLLPQEVARIVAADRPGTDWQGRVGRVIDATRTEILPRTMRIRPWGEKRPRRALGYGAGAAAVALAALALSLWRRRRETGEVAGP